MKESNRRPGIGWVRGDQAIDPKVLQETERLRIENADLRNRLLELTTDEIRFPSQLAGPELECEFVVQCIKYDRRYSPLEEKQVLAKAPIGDLFVSLFGQLLSKPLEYGLQTIIGGNIMSLSGNSIFTDYKCRIAKEDAKKLRVQFEALGLIRVEHIEGPLPGTGEFIWTITDKGRRYVSQRRAIAREK